MSDCLPEFPPFELHVCALCGRTRGEHRNKLPDTLYPHEFMLTPTVAVRRRSYL